MGLIKNQGDVGVTSPFDYQLKPIEQQRTKDGGDWMDDHAQLYERAKELECLYQVEATLKNKQLTFPKRMKELTELIPLGFTIPTACRIKITMGDDAFFADDFSCAEILQQVPLMAGYVCIGEITMGYIPSLLPYSCEILSNEITLLDTIANRVSLFALDKQRTLFSQWIQEQSRVNSSNQATRPAPIPQNIDPKNILFTAKQRETNGMLEGITYLVYLNDEGDNAQIIDKEWPAVKEALELLNDLLPWRHSILIATNTWFKRATTAAPTLDLSSMAAFVEIVQQKPNEATEAYLSSFFSKKSANPSLPLLSFTPDTQENRLKDSYLRHSRNLLQTLLPTFESLADVIKVIEIPTNSSGQTLSLHMNADLGKTIAFFTASSQKTRMNLSQKDEEQNHWQWRHYMAKQIANALDMAAFNVKGIYLFGSTNSGEAGMGSDIDLLIHVGSQSADQKLRLESWLDGWSQALASMNYLQTGYSIERLLDVHFVTDENIRKGDSFAIKINSFVDPPETLRLYQP